MNRIDRAALEQAVELCRAESAASRQRIDDRLASGGDWFSVASSCAFHRQIVALNLLPLNQAQRLRCQLVGPSG